MRTDVDMMFCCHSFTCSKVDSLPLLCCCNCRHADSSAGNTLPDSTACTPATEVADHHTHATTTNSALLLLVTAMLVASIHNAYWQESSSTIWCTKPALMQTHCRCNVRPCTWSPETKAPSMVLSLGTSQLAGVIAWSALLNGWERCSHGGQQEPTKTS